jgi:hypothetical protein
MAPSEVAKRLRKGAGKGSAEDQYEFGLLHYGGAEGVKRNLPTAAEWIKKAAMQGCAAAQAFLGDMHSRGDGVERDMEQAVVWWRKAASQDPGNDEDKRTIVIARSNLAKAYDTGGEGAHACTPFRSTLRATVVSTFFPLHAIMPTIPHMRSHPQDSRKTVI